MILLRSRPAGHSRPVASLGLCLALGASPGLAQEAQNKWQPHVDLEGKLGNRRNIREADFFLPLAQDGRTLYFANLRTRADNEGSREGNFGLGARHMLESGWNLGAYGYWDRRRSGETGYYYSQATLGAEALGRDWDLRANAYVPVGTRSRDLGGGGSSAQIVGSTIQVTTLGQSERSLQGFDAEAGWRLPLFDSEAKRQLRLYLGGYRFSDAEIKVEGPRARAELALEDLGWFGRGTALFLGAESQYDELRGNQHFVSIRLRIPLGKGSDGAPPLSAQARRMTAPIVRDVDIVTQRQTTRQVETAKVTTDGKTLTVIDAASTPDIAAAISQAGDNSTVILSGTFQATATVNLRPNQTVLGTTSLAVQTASGRSATLATPGATIQASYSSATALALVNMANGSTLQGVNINRSGSVNGSYGVLVSGVTDVRIIDNTIAVSTNVGSAFGVRIINAGSASVVGNQISAARIGGANNSVTVYVRDASAYVAGNTLNALSGTLRSAFYLDNAAIGAGSTGNVVVAGSCDIIPPSNGSSIDYTLNGAPGSC